MSEHDHDRPQSRRRGWARRFTYANTASTLALVMAFTGGGAAVAAGLALNSVRSGNIVNGEVKLLDVGANSVNSARVVDGSQTGADVKDGSLTAADINTGTLGLGIVAAGPVGSVQSLTTSFAQVATVTITAPKDGFVLLQGWTSINSADASSYITGRMTADGTAAGGERFLDGGDVDGFYDQSQSNIVVLPVTQGTHVYGWQLRESSASSPGSLYQSQLVAQFAPAGSVS